MRSFASDNVVATHLGRVRVSAADRMEFVGTRKYYVYSTTGRIHVGRSTRWTGPYRKPVDLRGRPTPYADRWTVSVLTGQVGATAVAAEPKGQLFGRWGTGSTMRRTPTSGAAEERAAELFFSHGLLAPALAVLPASRFAAATRRWRRARRGVCPSCGYDVRATPGRCPECGSDREGA